MHKNSQYVSFISFSHLFFFVGTIQRRFYMLGTYGRGGAFVSYTKIIQRSSKRVCTPSRLIILHQKSIILMVFGIEFMCVVLCSPIPPVSSLCGGWYEYLVSWIWKMVLSCHYPFSILGVGMCSWFFFFFIPGFFILPFLLFHLKSLQV